MRIACTRRLRAWLLVATFVSTLGLAQVSASHLELIDIACGETGLPGGDRAALEEFFDGSAQHCPVCHLFRAVSGASAAAVVSFEAPQLRVLLTPPTSQKPQAIEAVTAPSRGPPAGTFTAVSS